MRGSLAVILAIVRGRPGRKISKVTAESVVNDLLTGEKNSIDSLNWRISCDVSPEQTTGCHQVFRFETGDIAMSLFKAFKSSTSGQVGIITSVIALPMLAVAGLSFDVKQSTNIKVHASSALDYSSLAAAKMLSDATVSNAEIEAAARAFFQADMAQAISGVTCTQPTVAINRSRGEVRMSTGCQVPTTIGGLLRADYMTVSADSVARASITKLDIAFMLDVSGSMSGAKLEALKKASSDAIDTLIDDGTGDRVRIALVPYADAVNAGDFGSAVKNPLTPVDPANPATVTIDADLTASYAFGHSEKSCVSERAGSKAFRDNRPTVGAWIGEDATDCPDIAVQPITNNVDGLKATINDLSAGGSTAGHLGIAWSWYAVSPKWDNIWPSDSKPHEYGAKETAKAVVLMTDGEFNRTYESGQGDSDNQAEKLCDKMKDENIEIFAVAFEAPTKGKQILGKCATSADHFFIADDEEELKLAYQSIASKLSRLRVAK